MALACLSAAIYGALHNQVTYSVSPEYFQLFKFDQFGLATALRDRAGASLVGALSSWWMGLLLGLPLLLFLRGSAPGAKRLLFLGAILTMILCAALAGAAMWLAGQVLVPVGVDGEAEMNAAFDTAGMMHNGSYLGAALGFAIAAFRFRRLVACG